MRLRQLALVRRRLDLVERERGERDPVAAERLAIRGERLAAGRLDLLLRASSTSAGGEPAATSSAVSPTEPASAFTFRLRGVVGFLRSSGLRLGSGHARTLTLVSFGLAWQRRRFRSPRSRSCCSRTSTRSPARRSRPRASRSRRVKGALPEAELVERDPRRPRPRHPQQDAGHADGARRGASGCSRSAAFCIGTNQIELDAREPARRAGVQRAVLEHAQRRRADHRRDRDAVAPARRSRRARCTRASGRKVAAGCHEVRGKTLGIVGYGHIGSQVGVLAEAFGMRVVFYDIAAKLPMGNNRAMRDARGAARASRTSSRCTCRRRRRRKNMIGAAELAQMKKGACLLNASRGTVVDDRRARRRRSRAATSAAPRSTSIPRSPRPTATASSRRCAACRT